MKTTTGDYELLRPLGQGGFGEVWKARHLADERVLALKFLKLKQDQPVWIAQFKNEFEILSRLHHKNLAQVHHFGFTLNGNRRYFFTSEYCHGKPFVDFCEKLGAVEFINLLIQILTALDRIHSHGIVHLDIKSENILVQNLADAPLVKLIDFGIAAEMAKLPMGRVGTPVYMAPEMMLGKVPVYDHRVDLYALGILCYRYLAGRWPFETVSAREVLIWHRQGHVRREDLLKKDPPGSLVDLTVKLLAKNPSDRFSSARVAIHFLNAATGKRFLSIEKDLSHHIPERGPLIAREKLLVRFQEWMTDSRSAKTGHCLVLSLRGDRGAGKTRVLEEFCRLAELADLPLVQIRCARQASSWSLLAREFSGFLQDEHLFVPASAEAPSWHAKTLVENILSHANLKPFCFFVDDFDLADAESREFVLEMKRRLETGDVMACLVLTGLDLPEDSEPLHSLERAGIAAYLEELWGEQDINTTLVSLLWDYSAGNPGLLVEGLQYLAPQLDKIEDVRELKLPDMRDLFLAKLDRLTALQQDLILILSLWEHSVPEGVLLRIFQADTDSLCDSIMELKVSGLVCENNPGHFAVVNRALAQSVQARTDPEIKKSCHARIAELQKDMMDHDPGEVARHFEHAGLFERAAEFYHVAARQKEHFGQVLGAAQNEVLAFQMSSNPVEKICFGKQACRLFLLAGVYDQARIVLGGLKDFDDPDLAELRGEYHYRVREFADARTEYLRALEDTKRDVSWQIRILNALGNVELQSGNLEAARKHFEMSLSLEKKTAIADTESITGNNLGLVYSRLGRMDEAIIFYQERFKIYGNDRMAERLKIAGYLGYVLLVANRFSAAIACLKAAVHEAEQSRMFNLIFSLMGNLLTAYLKISRYDLALSLLKKMTVYQQKFGNRRDLAYNLLRQGGTTLTLGLNEASLSCLQKGLSLANELEDHALKAWFELMLGCLKRDTGQLDKASEHFSRARELAQSVGDVSVKSWCDLEEAELDFESRDDVRGASLLAGLSSDPSDPEFYARHQLLLIRLGEKTRKTENHDAGRNIKSALTIEQLIQFCESREMHEILIEVFHVAALRGGMDRDFNGARDHLNRSKSLISEIAGSLPEEFRELYLKERKRSQIMSMDIMSEDTCKEKNMEPSVNYCKLLEINRRLATEHDPDRLLEEIMDLSIELSGAEEGLLLILDERDNFDPRIARNIKKEDLNAIRFSQSIAFRVAKTGKPVFSTNALEDDTLNAFESVVALEVKSVACVPLKIHNKVHGVIYLATEKLSSPIQKEFMPSLEAFADQASLALQNALLFDEKQKSHRQLENSLVETRQELEQKEAEIEDLQSRVSRSGRNTLYTYDKIIGQSKKITDVLRVMDKVTQAKVPVFIHGETGTGKELIARALHVNSRRKTKQFVAINCSAFTETILESELFGYEKGSFTGADRERKGLFEQASGGTLFLDEVGDMSVTMQAKILRVIQEQEIMRVGGRTPVQIDVRVVSASHRDLRQMVKSGEFRQDLFFRLCGVTLDLPPLRERREDILLLVDHLLQKIRRENHVAKKFKLTRDALQKLISYPWPGNIRELEQVLTSSLLMADGETISAEHLILQKDLYGEGSLSGQATFAPSGSGSPADFIAFDPDKPLRVYELEIIQKTLCHFGNNKSETAKRLGISRLTLHKKVEEICSSFPPST